LRGDVHHAAWCRRHAEQSVVPVRPRPQCRCLRGDPPALARQHCHPHPHPLVSTAPTPAPGQLPKFADDAYAIERDDLWCIPTAEVPLTSIYAGETLEDLELPIRVMAYSA